MKKALVCGINYEGSKTALRGCINDARNMQKMLRSSGFEEVKMLIEKDATAAGIKAGLEWLVADTSPGDVIVFHFSGHGSQLPSKVEKDGWEEIICPYDLNWRDKVITDKDLKTVFNKAPIGVNVTLILDCCHAGDGLNQDESYSAPTANRGVVETGDEGRYLQPPPVVLKKIESGEMVSWSTERDVNRTALLVAASRSDQTSADAFIDGQFQGAASAAILKSVNANPSLTYKTLIEEMNEYMVSNRFSQRPQLDGAFGLHDEKFLQPFATDDASNIVSVTEAVLVPKTQSKDNSSAIVLFIVVAIISFLVFF